MSGGKPSVAETLGALPTDSSDMFAVFLPPHSTSEQVSLKKSDHHRPLVSGWKLDTEETSKQKPLKQTEGTFLEVTGVIA